MVAPTALRHLAGDAPALTPPARRSKMRTVIPIIMILIIVLTTLVAAARVWVQDNVTSDRDINAADKENIGIE
jgi:hypothetical protein